MYYLTFITRCASTVCTTSVHVLCFLLLNSLLDVIEINGCVSISVSATYLSCVCVVPGVNILLRKAALNITSYEEISVEEDNQEQWHIKHTSTFRSRESHPVVGQEFEETTMDGRRVKVGSTRMCTSVIRSHRYRRRVVLICLCHVLAVVVLCARHSRTPTYVTSTSSLKSHSVRHT